MRQAPRSWRRSAGRAYPKYNAPEALGSFRVAAGLYYVNAIEAGASCIEISCIGGVNAALLVQQISSNMCLNAQREHPRYKTWVS